MKKIYLFYFFLTRGLFIHAQKVIAGSSMNKEDKRISCLQTQVSNAGLNHDWKINKPKDGEWGCLDVFLNGTPGIFILKEVKLVTGGNYTFDGVIKNISAQKLVK